MSYRAVSRIGSGKERVRCSLDGVLGKAVNSCRTLYCMYNVPSYLVGGPICLLVRAVAVPPVNGPSSWATRALDLQHRLYSVLWVKAIVSSATKFRRG